MRSSIFVILALVTGLALWPQAPMAPPLVATSTPLLENWSGNNYVAGTNSQTLTTNQVLYYSFNLPAALQLNGVAYRTATADNSANLYDLGIYTLGCSLITDVGPTAGSTLFAATGFHNVGFLNPGTITLQPGTYLFAITGNASTANLNAVENVQSYTRVATSGGTSTGGQLPASCTPVAKTPAAGASQVPWFMLY